MLYTRVDNIFTRRSLTMRCYLQQRVPHRGPLQATKPPSSAPSPPPPPPSSFLLQPPIAIYYNADALAGLAGLYRPGRLVYTTLACTLFRLSTRLCKGNALRTNTKLGWKPGRLTDTIINVNVNRAIIIGREEGKRRRRRSHFSTFSLQTRSCNGMLVVEDCLIM